MKVVESSYEIIYPNNDEAWLFEARLIELAARNCYKSEDKITDLSYQDMLKMLVGNNHGAMLEFGNFVVKLVCDRATANELVRHRLASYAQESTRYCNYARGKFGQELTVIQPCNNVDQSWKMGVEAAERAYLGMIAANHTPDFARSILPLCLKTEVMMKCNWRELLHIFDLRCSERAHPQIRELFQAMQRECREKMSCIFS